MVTLLENYEISNATPSGEDTAMLDNLLGFVAREKQIQFPDPRAQYNPWAENSVFRQNTWRNGKALITDKFGNTEFFGAINDISYKSSKDGRMISVNTREQFATLLGWYVEELNLVSDATTAYQYSVSGDHAAGDNTITLDDTGSPAVITVGSFLSFGLFNVPRYQITAVTAGSPTPSITIDRGLEYAVTGATVLRVMEPVSKTGPEAIKDALIAAGLSSFIGQSFDLLNIIDLGLSNTLRLFIRYENKVSLGDHIRKVCDMCDLYITTNKNGIINVVRGKQYDGYAIDTEVTDSELIADSVSIAYDKSGMFYAYDTLYNTGGQVQVTSDQVSATILARWAAKERWQPVPAQGNTVDGYPYLYDNVTAAAYFGDRKIAYNGVPRARLTASCKAYQSGDLRSRFNFTIGRKLLVTHKLGGGKHLYKEPAIVTKVADGNARNIYSNIEFELTNWLYPNLSVGSLTPTIPEVTYLVTESGEYITTEAGDFITV